MTKPYKSLDRVGAAAAIAVLVFILAGESAALAAHKPGGLTPLADPSNVGYILVRSYLPADGFDAVPLPTLTVIKNGVEHQLPVCPWRAYGFEPNFRAAVRHFAQGRENLSGALRKIARAAGVRRRGVAPYCSWWFVLDNDSFNIAYPDAGARYWGTPFVADENTEIRIDGVFADQRYMSLIVYDSGLNFFTYVADDGETKFPSYLPDYKIEPNEEGANPFQDEQGYIDAPYSVTIKANPQPGETNVLPAFPNKPPEAAEVAAMSAPNDGQLNLPGVLPLPCNVEDSPYTCTAPTTFSAPPSGAQAGFFGNPDNAYVPALIDLRVPRAGTEQQDRVYVIRGKIPVTPEGKNPVPWPDENFDMRYWSFCTGAYIRPYPTTEGDFACVADDAIVRTDEGGKVTPDGEYFTLVVSTEEGRPTTLTGDPETDGVNWLRGIGYARTILLLRNMLPSDGFKFAAQNVPRDGSWVTAVGSMQGYYPAITVQCTKEHFEQHGWGACVAPRIDGTHPDEDAPSPPGAGVPGTPG